MEVLPSHDRYVESRAVSRNIYTSGSNRVSSPSPKPRSSSVRESISASKLFRDLSPTRTYSALTAEENSVNLPDLFRQKNGLQALRPTSPAIQLASNSPTEVQEAPRLLQRLEALLQEKLKLVDRLGSSSNGFAAAQLKTDAYRQVFDAFLHSFTTYRALLMRVKSEYDAALDDALSSLYDNVHMKAQLAAFQKRLATSIQAAKRKAADDATAMRAELQGQLDDQEFLASQTEQRFQTTEAELHKCRASIYALNKQSVDLQHQNRALKLTFVVGSTWSSPQLLARYSDAPPAT